MINGSYVGCFNSQPPEGGWIDVDQTRILSNVSTHSRPKAAGALNALRSLQTLFQLTAARRRLADGKSAYEVAVSFQLTAARRRLDEKIKIP